MTTDWKTAGPTPARADDRQGEAIADPAAPPRVLVIGAGPAGLTAALELRDREIPTTVLEADDQVGGISRTVERNGWRFDIGGHRFYTKASRVAAFWHRVLGPEDFLTRPRLSRIYYEGKFFAYPIKPLDALRKLGMVEAFRCVVSYISVRLRPPEDQSDFESWVAARFGWRLYRIFFKTYTEKVWGIPAGSIRSDWAAQRIKGVTLPAAVFNSFRSYFAPTKHASLIEQFEYPRLGPGMMWERVAELIEEQGGTVLLNKRVASITSRSDGTVVVTTSGHSGYEEFVADHVLSTMPINELALAFDPPAPPAVIEAAKGLKHRDFLTVALTLPAEHGFPDNWIYVHDSAVRLGRVQNFGAWSEEMVKPTMTCLGLEYFVSEGDELWRSSDEELVALGTEDIERIGLVTRGVVQEGFVVRMPRAYPVYDAGYAERVATIRAWLEAEHPNVVPVGRNGMHRYNNQDHSMLTGMLAIENLGGASHDLWSVNVDTEYLESGRYGAAPRDGRAEMFAARAPGRLAPMLLSETENPKEAALGRRDLPAKLRSLCASNARARSLARFAFRNVLQARRSLRRIARALSPKLVVRGRLGERLGWAVYHLAFRAGSIRALRAVHFRLRDVASRHRQEAVPLTHLLVGGWNGMSAARFASASGNFLDPSTRLGDSAQVALLRAFDKEGEALYEDERLRATPYFARIRAAADISGHHRGARTDAELLGVAREFLDRYRGLPVPYRPGRTTEGMLPRVRRVEGSSYFEVRDGHHRLAIALAEGDTTTQVIVERPRVRTPAQELLRELSWLDGQRRLYQPVELPELEHWPLMRRCHDRLGMMLEFLSSSESPAGAVEGGSYLDLGACYGWFVSEMLERGWNANGIEDDPRAPILAENVYGLDPKRLIVGDALKLLANTTGPSADIVSCFSMLHHFVLGRGSASAEALMALLDRVTGSVLFLDTGEGHESWFRYVLPEWTPEYTQQWILDHTSFTRVVGLGTDHDDASPFSGKFGRTLFACTR